MIYLDLLITFLIIGLFSFGGGLASMEVIRSRVVTDHMWLSNAEFSDIVSISEMTPGPLGINIASFTGVRIGGSLGTVITTFAYVLPAFVIVMIMAWFYYRYRSLRIMQGVLKGLRPAIAAMVIASAVSLTKSAVFMGDTISAGDINIAAVVLTFVFLILLQKKKLSPVQAILASGAAGALVYGLMR